MQIVDGLLWTIERFEQGGDEAKLTELQQGELELLLSKYSLVFREPEGLLL